MKKVLSLVLAAAMVLSMGVVSFAASADIDVTASAAIDTMDDDGNTSIQLAAGKTLVADAQFGETYYIDVADLVADVNAAIIAQGGAGAASTLAEDDLMDSDLFTFSVSKSTNGAIVKSVSREERIKLGTTRYNAIEIVLNDSTTTDEKKVEFTFTFKAKKDSTNKNTAGDPVYLKNDKINFDVKLYVTNHEEVGTDTTMEAGDKFIFTPESNDKNEVIWTNASGDDIAKLAFEANDDADSFYAKLSTKYNTAIATKYGDPVGAEMYFWTFTGASTIDSTARATLTLYNPFDEEDDVDFANGYWYTVDADGVVSEVKTLSYVDTDEDGNDVDGFRVKTRTLGNYIFSDVELDLEEVNADAKDDGTTDADGKPIPNTGSSDMVNVAVVAAVVSLAAAGAVAFKKASK